STTANWPSSSPTPVRPDTPLRNRVVVCLSVKAGLRAGEIANLTWDMALNPSGRLAKTEAVTVPTANRSHAIPAQTFIFRIPLVFRDCILTGSLLRCGDPVDGLLHIAPWLVSFRQRRC